MYVPWMDNDIEWSNFRQGLKESALKPGGEIELIMLTDDINVGSWFRLRERVARSMTYRQLRPVVVKMVKKVYRSGVTIKKKKAMLAIEKKLERKRGLEFWSIRIAPQVQMG